MCVFDCGLGSRRTGGVTIIEVSRLLIHNTRYTPLIGEHELVIFLLN